MLMSACLLIFGQLDVNAVDFERPIQSLSASFETDISFWGLEELSSETPLEDLVKNETMPLAIYLSKSLLLPRRKDELHYSFSMASEIYPPKPIRDWTEPEWKAFSELNVGVCEILLSDIQHIFFPPYVITARAIAVKKVELTDHATHRSVEFIAEDPTHFSKLSCVLPLKAQFKEVQEALPTFLSIVKRTDIDRDLPIEKESKTQNDFVINDRLNVSSFDWGSYSDPQNKSEFQKFMDQPLWRTQKGFDSWGYYNRAETYLGDGKSLRFEIRSYDRLLGPRYYPYDPNFPYRR